MLAGAGVGVCFKSGFSWAGEGGNDGEISIGEHSTQRSYLGTRKDNPARVVAGVDAAGRKAAASIAAALAGVEGGENPTRFPWDDKTVERSVCTDTCARARDGTCDDGRSGAGQVFCDLGTDCADCGPWKHRGPAGGNASAAPIQALVARGVEVYVARTKTVPSFIMPFTNPKHDVDVSGQMHSNGQVELGITQIWYTRLKEACAAKPDAAGKRPPRLVADVGANFGYYSLYAATMGCRVLAWEPVPTFRAFLEYGVELNRLGGLVDVRAAAVSDKAGAEYELVVPQRGIWGTASIDGRNIDKNINNEGAYEKYKVKGERVDAVVAEDVALLKMDVEGFEPTAFESAKGVLDTFKVENIVMEYSPGVYDTTNRWDDYPDWPRMLIYLLEHGFSLLHVRDEFVRAALLGPEFDGALPPFEEITAENLACDLEDAKKLQARTLGCQAPEELSSAFPEWVGCNFIPENLHPKSFRGYIGHNTNVWAAASRTGIKVGQPAGVQGLAQAPTEWYGRDRRYGMGRRECKYLPLHIQVKHRCHCADEAVCGAEAAMVERLAAEGLLTPNNGALDPDDVPVLPGLDEDPEEVKKAAAKEAAAKRKAEGGREIPEDR
ncbi:hypothetical protein WJX81_001323 [Elliptochloris bilobata]|uniref:Methyltransferase FkbM domain-containing protein n=1 Tax=Elliptochloris bilobata TaxID=381761 RepID=A0AAW1S968_9CHLO